jgi:hypothetical protein
VGTIVYKDHTIIAGAKRDELSGKYKPIAHIAWRKHDGRRAVHAFALPETCASFEAASARACESAQEWVDRRLEEPSSEQESAVTRDYGGTAK